MLWKFEIENDKGSRSVCLFVDCETMNKTVNEVMNKTVNKSE